MIMDKIRHRAIDASPLCVGIDLRESHIPQEMKDLPVRAQFLAYAKEVIEASKDYAACYKVQIACYETYGIEGLIAYKEILAVIKAAGHYVIADIKRGDIGSTGEQYAKGHFTGDFEADVVTLNPYMGYDAISAFAEYRDRGKGAFILGKTSNPSGRDFQDLLVRAAGLDAEKDKEAHLYEAVLNKIKDWNHKIKEEASTFGALGAVVGVNQADDLNQLSRLTQDTFLLIPGYGAQGAKLEDIRALIKDKQNGVVNVSRGLTANIEGDYRKVLAERASTLAKELKTCFK